jgi:hypothetical protein
MLANGARRVENPQRMSPAKKRRRVCIVKGCTQRYMCKGFCGKHYQRSLPRADGSLPTFEEIALGAQRPPPRRHDIAGRVDDDAYARLQRGVELRLATSIYDLISRLAMEFNPDEALARWRKPAA